MDQSIHGVSQKHPSPHIIPTERPLPPVPLDEERDTEDQGQEIAIPSRGQQGRQTSDLTNQLRLESQRSHPLGEGGSAQDRGKGTVNAGGSRADVPAHDSHADQVWMEAQRAFEEEVANERDSQNATGTTKYERPSSPGEGSSQPLTSSLRNWGGPDLSTLDIYGSSGDEGSEHGDSESRDIERAIYEQSVSPEIPRRKSSRSAPPLYEDDTQDGGASALLSRPSLGQRRRSPIVQADVVVPRWQPDAEVTFCPICRTQFNFFVRKHHCRKCGRVVCNSCSPHRITIPYQYIVQPPTETASSSTRPSLDPRAGSSSVVTSLGGGERVRLCNPCVPDPNIAPPQTRSDGLQSPQGHSRSVSSAAAPYIRSGSGQVNPRSLQPRHPGGITSSTGYHSRYYMAGLEAGDQGTSSSLGGLGSTISRPDLEARSRSSTVGTQQSVTMTRGNRASGSRPDNDQNDIYGIPHTGRTAVESDTRPLPNTPSSQSRPHQARRRRIPEEDECWVCHRELPSRTLPNFESLREAHTSACIQAAMEPHSRATATPPTLPPQPSITRPRFNSTAQASSSSTPPPSTPESRSAQRERDHAAVVLGRSSHQTPGMGIGALSRVIPYTASEKDCVDDAECTICLEEFEVGEKMGRLECFCRFHMRCIEGWFEMKPGKCPVHGVDG